jgi:hemoglobin
MNPPSPSPDRPVYVPPGGPPTEGPSREIYAAVGLNRLLALCATFYRELEQSEIRPMFPEDMPGASRHLALFLAQVMGGPPLYTELRGAPRMRMRHLPFRIDEHARQVWLQTFLRVFGDGSAHGFPPEHVPGFLRFLDGFSGWMVNSSNPT